MDVKRCFTMRDALILLDFDDASIGDLKRLLLRAAFSPAFLRASEGRRFLAFLFTLQVINTHSQELHLDSIHQTKTCQIQAKPDITNK